MQSAELLDRAAEYDRLAKAAAKPERKTKYANIAEYFRYLARELQSIPDPLPSSTARRAKEKPTEAGVKLGSASLSEDMA